MKSVPNAMEKPVREWFAATVDPAIFGGLLLVGTVHHDPEGFGRVRHLLRKVRPEMILVEISPYSLAYRTEHRRELQKALASNLKAAAAAAGIPPQQAFRHPRIAAVRTQLQLPFEYRAAYAFSKETGAELHAVDSSSFSRKWIRTWSELITTENLATLLSLPMTTTSMSHAYQLAEQRIRGQALPTVRDLKKWNTADKNHWGERERYLAAQVTKAIESSHPRRGLYLGGWQRIVQGGPFPSLREILDLSASQCLLLHRAEDFLRRDCSSLRTNRCSP